MRGRRTRDLLFGALGFLVLNTLLTLENSGSGAGLRYMPRLSFELCLGTGLLMAWTALRGRLSVRAAGVAALGLLVLAAVRYVDVTAPAVLGRPVHLYWDGRHAWEVLQLMLDGLPHWQLGAGLMLLGLGAWMLFLLVRASVLAWTEGLAAPTVRRLVLAGIGVLALSFAAHEPGVRDTRWFFALPVTPTIVDQATLLARLALPRHADALSPSPSFAGNLAALRGADVLMVFAESYGAVTFDDPLHAAALQAPRARLAQAIAQGGRGVVSARVRSPTYGGSSWLAHAALLTGVDTADPADHALLLASDRPTLVQHFARQGYRTVAWMPGLQRPWPEGAYFGFDRIADLAGIGYVGPDFGYWRVPDQAALALLHEQELQRPTTLLPVAAPVIERAPRFVVFPTLTTHAPFHPLPPYADDWPRLTGPQAYDTDQLEAARHASRSPQQPVPAYLDALRYQFDWLVGYLQHRAGRGLLLIVVGDHQPLATVSGRGASWDVPVHIISDDAALLQRFIALGFEPGLQPAAATLARMEGLTGLLLRAFDQATRATNRPPTGSHSQAWTSPEGASAGSACSHDCIARASSPSG